MLNPKQTLNFEISRRQALVGLGVAGIALGLAPEFLVACAGTGQSQTNKLPDTLTWGLSGPVAKLDPATNGSFDGNRVIALGYEGLLVYDAQGAPKPLLAKSWSQPDPLTYVFELRDGVKFWDGTPLTADDVVFSLTRVRDPKTKSIWATFLSKVASVDVTGKNAVTVKLKVPDPKFKYATAYAARILSKKFVESSGSDFGTSAQANMGTGPYKFTEFTAAQTVTVVRNENYWGGTPKFKSIKFQTITDPSAMELAMRSGSVDGTYTIPLDSVSRYQAIPGVHVQTAPAVQEHWITFDVSKAPWSDVHVRRAIAYAVDKKGIVSAAQGGYGAAASSIVIPQQWLGLLSDDQVKQFDASLPQYPFDLNKAKAELAQSSVPNGFSAQVLTTVTYPQLTSIAQIMSSNLKQIGIQLEIKDVPYTTWEKAYYEIKPRDVSFMLGEWAASTTDVSEFTFFFDPSDYYNWASYNNPQLLPLIAQSRNSLDPSARAAAMKQIISINADQAVYIPVAYLEIAMAIKRKYVLKNLSPWNRWQNWPEEIESA